jgi:hypothetical protein
MRTLRTMLALTLLAVAATATIAATPASAVTVNCHVKRYAFLFWPRGHHSIPRIGFPLHPLAHVDFYRLGSSYSERNKLGYIDREGGGSFAAVCNKVPAPRSFSRVGHAHTTRVATALRCGFTSSPRIAVHPVSSNDEELGIHVVLGSRSVAFFQLLDHRAPRLTYDGRYCRKTAPPH